MSFIVATSAVVIFCTVVQAGINPATAYQYFREAQRISEKDDGDLWGVPLYGPMIFVDRATREVVANQADGESRLQQEGSIWRGKLPPDQNIANTATSWAGVKWTMLIWPLPSDEHDRARLMMHELFHRIQDDLGLPASNPENRHLDARDGRIWLRLEWRALRRALLAESDDRKQAIADALAFRFYRQSLFPGAAAEERALEMNEGLAEYTGLKLCGLDDAAVLKRSADHLRDYESRSSYVRSFAYASGPAYGLLLDAAGADWRESVKRGDDPGRLLQAAFSIADLPTLPDEVLRRAQAYDASDIIASEDAREQARRERAAQFRQRYVDSPVLIIALSDDVNYSFDPNKIESFENEGSVYATLRVTDEWGILEVSGGALMIRRQGRPAELRVPAPPDPDARPLTGDGWTLRIHEGWSLSSGSGAGDYTLVKR